MSEPDDTTLDLTLPDITGSQSNVELSQFYAPGVIVGGTYRLKEFIGKGGMGYVFCAEHTIIGQEYALKILAPEQVNETNWRRFLSEGKAIARLNHRNVVHIYNMGIDREQCPFYVMDLLYGASLSELVAKTGPIMLPVAIEIFLQLCLGLSYAHRVGVIHRDIKPSNIILHGQAVAALEDEDSVPVVKIVDFGLAKLIRIHGDSLQRITNTGQVFGTPLYMSPEQCMSGTVDARSDIYSLGCTLYEALTGRPPFSGENAMETVLMHLDKEPLRLSQIFPQGRFSQSIELLVAKMLKKDPVQRYQTMAQVAHDLERIKQCKTVVQPAAGARAKVDRGPVDSPPALSEKAVRNDREIVATVAVIALVAGLGSWALFTYMQTSKESNSAIKVKSSVEAVANFEDMPNDQDKLGKVFAALPSFSLGVHGSGAQRKRLFQFSDQYSVGTLSWDGGQSIALGKVAVPAEKQIELRVDDRAYALERKPQLLAKFNADDITGLQIRSDNWPVLLQQVVGWHNLKSLTLRKISLSSEDLSSIDTLSQLTSLRLEECDFDPDALAQLKILPRLERLELESGRDSDGIIKAVAGSKNIRIFKLSPWPCNALTLSYLAQCPNLSEIRIVATNLRDQDLIILEKMPSLTVLVLGNSKLTPKCANYLRHLHALGILDLQDLRWSRAEKDKLKREIPAYQH